MPHPGMQRTTYLMRKLDLTVKTKPNFIHYIHWSDTQNCMKFQNLLTKIFVTKKIDFNNLDGIIEDYACGVNQYALNREPEDFEYLIFLVDGSHWQSQRKLKKPDSRSGKGGHLGCSKMT